MGGDVGVEDPNSILGKKYSKGGSSILLKTLKFNHIP